MFLPLVHADVDLREIVGMGAGEEPTRTVMTTLAKLAIACREKMREERFEGKRICTFRNG